MPLRILTIIAILIFTAFARAQNAATNIMEKIVVGDGADAVTVLIPKTIDIPHEKTVLHFEMRDGDVALIPVADLLDQLSAWLKKLLPSGTADVSEDAVRWLATNSIVSGPFIIDPTYAPLGQMALRPTGRVSNCHATNPSSNNVALCITQLFNQVDPKLNTINLIIRNTPSTEADLLVSYLRQKGFDVASRVYELTEPVKFAYFPRDNEKNK